MKLSDLTAAIHQNAVDHGWWEAKRSFGEIIALCHSELSEALEEYREHKPNVYFMKQDKMSAAFGECDMDICTDIGSWKGEKPEGVAVELADCIIRILDYFGYRNYDTDKLVMNFGSLMKIESFGDFITLCHASLSYAYCNGMVEGDWMEPLMMFDCITYIYKWADINKVDMDEVIKIKCEFNKTRPYRHGGKKI